MEVINSFFNNIKDKLTNPYFGTLILLLAFRHWELLYAILNFDPEVKLVEKLNYIKSYGSTNITITTVLCDAIYALFLMLFGYFAIIITVSTPPTHVVPVAFRF